MVLFKVPLFNSFRSQIRRIIALEILAAVMLTVISIFVVLTSTVRFCGRRMVLTVTLFSTPVMDK